MKDRKQLIEVGYDDNLSLDEAQTRLETIARIVEDIHIKYAASAVGSHSPTEQIEITPEDTALLNQCFGMLLPLSAQPSVQKEFGEAGPGEESATLFAKTADLQSEVLMYASGVFDSGVELLGFSGPPRRTNKTIALV